MNFKNKIKVTIKESKILRPLVSNILRPLVSNYRMIKRKREDSKKFLYHGIFENRSKGHNILCVMLAGYKNFLYRDVFERFQNALIPEMDICIATSGKFEEEIKELCEKNGWSYLSTKENDVCLVQNIAINLHPSATLIFKLDEDIFLTQDFFINMLRAYNHAKEGYYNLGIIAPIIPINGYGYVRVLKKLQLEDIYRKKFGKIKIGASKNGRQLVPIEGSVDIAKFMWGDGDIVPSIDEMNSLFSKMPLDERPCCVRFSIGAILFKRKLWEEMRYFDVDLSSNSMGKDEIKLCQYCCITSQPILVSENVVVGHFSFGSQTEGMKKYYEEHKEKFKLKK